VEIMLKQLSFELREVWHYDPHGIISNKRKDINDFAYEHEFRLELEWKANSYSWPINTEMEIETSSVKEKTQKSSIDEVGDTKMEDASSAKKEKIQEQTEEEIEVKLTTERLNQPGL